MCFFPHIEILCRDSNHKTCFNSHIFVQRKKLKKKETKQKQMLASFGTFLSPLYDIKLFINLMMAAAAVCQALTDGYLHEFGYTL